jgi:peptidoglycan/LPS O-acetylase OafA/YrhL
MSPTKSLYAAKCIWPVVTERAVELAAGRAAAEAGATSRTGSAANHLGSLRAGCPAGAGGAASSRGEKRPEIQALRAAAVLLVVTSHLWPSAVPGGFVGVDVFFAISGFLITSLLLREIDRTGRVSLSGFWARRARRILPAALVTLLFCAVATIVFVPLNHWQQFFTEMRASTEYVQNWHLAERAVDYFAADDGPSPVQHFWSLSVEEQFYVAWPVLMLVAVGVTRNRDARVQKRSLATVIAAVTALSLAYALYDTPANPAAAYFVTPTRAWEFGLGGLLALLPSAERTPDAMRGALSWIGIGAIAVAVLAYTASTPFPGYAALLPILGAVAVMGAGAPSVGWAPTRLLGLRPIQFVGDVSYSIYLWHWPLLILAPFVLNHQIQTQTALAVFTLTLLAAWLTKLFIEDPVRTGAFLTRRSARWTFALAAAGTAVVLGVSADGVSHVQAEMRKAERVTREVLAAKPTCFGAAARDPGRPPCENPRLRFTVVPSPIQARQQPNAPCHVAFYLEGKDVCEFGVSAAKASETIALIGDSHAGVWRLPLELSARVHRWRGLRMGHAGCPLSNATKRIAEPNRSHCIRWKARVIGWLGRHPEVSTVFVSQMSGGTGVTARPGEQFGAAMKGYTDGWKAIPSSVRRIIVIRDNPKVDGETDTCIQRAMRHHKRAGIVCAVPRARALERDPAAVAALRLHSPRVHVVDLTPLFCDRRLCYPVIGGVLVFKDTTHLTGLYARTLGPFLLRQLERPMASWGW